MNDEQRRMVDAIIFRLINLPAEQREPELYRLCPDDSIVQAEVLQRLSRAHETVDPGDSQLPLSADDSAAAGTEFASNPSTPDPLIGTKIGPYHILERIGSGGFGHVYKAEQRQPMHRTVALKVIKAGFDTEEVIARFDSERQALAMMDHPNIAKVLDAGSTEPTDGGFPGRPFFAMEYVPGLPIVKFADEHKLSMRERLLLFCQVCDAISHAHQKAIIHRDIKSSNVLAYIHDGKALVKVIDFGIAKALDSKLTDLTLNTGQGVVIGTYECMSPEQAAGSVDIDTRTDVYSLGVLLYELLTGVKPFDRIMLAQAADHELRRIICEVDPPRPSTQISSMGIDATRIAMIRQSKVNLLTRQLKRELEWIPLKAMRKERHRRYASALQLSEDIQKYLRGDPLVAGPESRSYRIGKFIERRRGPLTLTAALLLIAMGGVTFYIHSIRVEQANTETQRRRAVANSEDAQKEKSAAQAAAARAELSRADMAMQRGRWADALDAYNNAEADGADDFVRLTVGRSLALEGLGRTAEALHEFGSAIQKHPAIANNPSILINQAEAEWPDNPQEAERKLRSGLQQNPSPSDRAYALALLADSVPESIAQFKRVLALEPFRQDAIGMLTILSVVIGDWPEAEKDTTAWIAMFPDDPSARVIQSLQFAMRGDAIRAAAVLDDPAAAKLGPDLTNLVRETIQTLAKYAHSFSSGETPAITSLFRIQGLLSGISGENALGRHSLRYPKAVTGFAPHIMSAASKMIARQWVAADSELAAAEKILPVGFVIAIRGLALQQAGKRDEAINAYELACVAPSPFDISGFAHMAAGATMAEAELAKGRPRDEVLNDQRIIDHFRLAAERGGLSSEYLWESTLYFVGNGRKLDEAATIASLWTKAAPTNPLPLLWDADIKYLGGNYVGALRQLDSVAARFPDLDLSAAQSLHDAARKAIDERADRPPGNDVPTLPQVISIQPRKKPTTAAAATTRSAN